MTASNKGFRAVVPHPTMQQLNGHGLSIRASRHASADWLVTHDDEYGWQAHLMREGRIIASSSVRPTRTAAEDELVQMFWALPWRDGMAERLQPADVA